MNYEKVVRDIVLPIVEDKDQLMVKLMPTDNDNDLVIMVMAKSTDIARLIGKNGTVANSIREVVNVAGKINNQHLHVKFEAFSEEE